MAVSKYYVFYQQQSVSDGVDGLKKEWTKAEAEAVNPAVTEKVIITGPARTANYILVEAETEAMAAKFVKNVITGAGGTTEGKFNVVPAAEFKEATQF